MRLATDQVTKQEVGVLLRELQRIVKSGISGDVVELGCYEGGSAIELQRFIRQNAPERKLYLYDSFEGLPNKTKEDESVVGTEFTAGALKASQSQLKRNFTKAGLPVPEITRAWFFELDPDDMPDQIALAFLDGDFYESIMDSLKLVWSKITVGGVVIIDDYHNSKLPGVKRAVETFFGDVPHHIQTEVSLAIIRSEK